MTSFLAAACDAGQWGCGHRWGPGPRIGLFWLAVISTLLILWFTRWRHRPVRDGERVLAERYARGVIDESEYRSRRDVLRKR
jgi:uncharacterized membrane protein